MSVPRRMVVVDDDPKVRMLLERAFRAPEFETWSFPTGKAALEKVSDIRPDCVVSDVLMPDMDGERFLRALRATPGLEGVPFVALSAVRSEARIRSVLGAGADAFLVKPFPLRELIEKARSLFDRPAPLRAIGAPAATGTQPPPPSDVVSPTMPLLAVAHTTSTSSLPRRPASALLDEPRREPEAGVTRPTRVPPVEPTPSAQLDDGEPHVREDVHPSKPSLGFGRYTRVEARGRSLVVLTEATALPKFTVTTVITEKGQALRKIESALPHALARDEDRELVRHQVDMQHEDALHRLGQLVLDQTTRRVLWSDQSRSVDPDLLAWALSAIAQLVETEAGTEETTRILQSSHESVSIEEDLLRVFHVTPLGRVIVHVAHRERLPRRAVGAVAAWSLAFTTQALQLGDEGVVEPIRHATQRHETELERLGFYSRLRRRARA